VLKISDRMIDAGVEALQRRGYGLDNEPIESLRVAVKAVFCAMAEASRGRIGDQWLVIETSRDFEIVRGYYRTEAHARARMDELMAANRPHQNSLDIEEIK